MRTPQILKPTELSNQKLAFRYERHPGPYPITTGWQCDLDKIFPGIMDIEFDIEKVGRPGYGEMNESETELVYRITKWLEPRILVELGTFNGRTTRIMAEQSPLDARILTVDLPEDYTFVHPYSTDVVFTKIRDIASPQYKESKDAYKVTQVYMDATSKEFEIELDRFRDGKTIDLAIVDAAHDFDTTKRLFGAMHNLLSYGGVILCDDYGRMLTSIGVTEFFANKAREEGFLFYYFCPEPSNAKSPSGLIFPNVDGSVRDWKK